MLAKRNQFLREMGIDVWVLRGDKPVVDQSASTAASGASSDMAGADSTTPDEPARASAARSATSIPPPEFHLCFVTYGNVSLIFSVPANSSQLPEPMRRLMDDIALAIGRKVEPLVSALKWPMVKAKHIDQSEETARAVLKDRLGGCGPIRVLFGEAAERFGRQTGDEIVVRDVGEYFSTPLAKRDLWRSLQRIRAVENAS